MKITVIGGGPGGLYFALLMKKARPDCRIAVYERNRADDTFGFGVVFSDETLAEFLSHDPPSYERIREDFAYWDDIVISFKGHRIRCSGNGFCGSSRQYLLGVLQDRCREVGVDLHFEQDITDLDQFADSDVIVACDGVNSWIRQAHAQEFGVEITHEKNKFTWLGSTVPLGDFHYFFQETEYGIFNAHCYEYQPGMGTWVMETTEAAWRASGLDRMVTAEGEIDAQGLELLESIFADELQGHKLLTNRSLWRNFPTVRCQRWSYRNIVLLGDAKATAHWSIGSGTKLAMESAIALSEALAREPTVEAAFDAYRRARDERVGITQHAADVSLAWFEHVKRYWHLEPLQFAFGVMSRSKQITYDNLKIRDAGFVAAVDREFAEALYRTQGFDYRKAPPPPMFTRFRLRELELPNRVVVSPMAQYCAAEGTPTDWHFVHLASRALGGAGLVYTEMTCPSPEARFTPGCSGMYHTDHVAAWRRIVEFVHENTTAKICLQLGHSGRKGSTQLGWEQMDHPLAAGNWPVMSASPIPYLAESQVPREMTRADMDRVRDEFVAAVNAGIECGFDMLEVHMAHGYLLASFISPLTNRRSDDYGGTLGNRLRFPLEVFTAMRAAWPQERPMAVRISATDWYPGGTTAEDLVGIASAFKAAGADLLDVSAGQTVPDQRPVYGRMFQTQFADQARHEAGIATMAVGNITDSAQVNTILAAGRADLVALARPHLTDPYFTQRAAAYYDVALEDWPLPYLTGRDQAYRLAEKQRAQELETRLKLRPPSHGEPKRSRTDGGPAQPAAAARRRRQTET